MGVRLLPIVTGPLTRARPGALSRENAEPSPSSPDPQADSPARRSVPDGIANASTPTCLLVSHLDGIKNLFRDVLDIVALPKLARSDHSLKGFD